MPFRALLPLLLLFSISARADQCDALEKMVYRTTRLDIFRKTISEAEMGGPFPTPASSVWFSPEHAALRARIEAMNSKSKGKSTVYSRMGEINAATPEQAQEMKAILEKDGAEIEIDAEAKFQSNKNFLIVRKLPKYWEGTYLQTVFEKTNQLGGMLVVAPRSALLARAMQEDKTILIHPTAFGRSIAIHELKHLMDHHSPEFWKEVLALHEKYPEVDPSYLYSYVLERNACATQLRNAFTSEWFDGLQAWGWYLTHQTDFMLVSRGMSPSHSFLFSLTAGQIGMVSATAGPVYFLSRLVNGLLEAPTKPSPTPTPRP